MTKRRNHKPEFKAKEALSQLQLSLVFYSYHPRSETGQINRKEI